MATPVASAVPSLQGDSPVSFFDLSRELRDIIYDQLPKQQSVLRADGARLILRNGPRLSLLCVSKQFGHEYTECVQRQAILKIDNLANDYRKGSKKEVPVSLRQKYSTRLEVQLSYSCTNWPGCGHETTSKCPINKGIRNRTSRLKSLLKQMEGVKDCRLLVKFVSHWSQFDASEALTIALDKLVLRVKVPALSCIEATGGFVDTTGGTAKYPDAPLGQWSPQAGWSWTGWAKDPA